MEMYKQASKVSLRFQTSYGSLTVEQLWSLSLNKLSTIIKNLKKQIKTNDDDELSFLDESKTVDAEKQLQFDILKDVYLTKKQEIEAEKRAASDKENNQYILNLIKTKQDQELANKSIEELQAMLR